VGKSLGSAAGGGGDNKADNVNPKQEVIALGCKHTDSTFEIAEPLLLASWQHGYAVGPSDHQLFLTIGNDFASDLFVCPKTVQTADPTGLPHYAECLNQEFKAGTHDRQDLRTDRVSRAACDLRLTGTGLHPAVAEPAVLPVHGV
jgi:hypothetical protein